MAFRYVKPIFYILNILANNRISAPWLVVILQPVVWCAGQAT